MFTARCPNHEGVVLLDLTDIEELRNTSAGIEVTYRCNCGHHGTWVTGRRNRFSNIPTEQ